MEGYFFSVFLLRLKIGLVSGAHHVILKTLKKCTSCTWCCYVRIEILIVRVEGMSCLKESRNLLTCNAGKGLTKHTESKRLLYIF